MAPFFNCFAINMALQYKKIGKWKINLWKKQHLGQAASGT
ncbi:MAG: hypothetical protein NTV74_05820 [Euryarchaeota archaeon]|nr:hypothetical protein [Euryarchaeota archaeon]